MREGKEDEEKKFKKMGKRRRKKKIQRITVRLKLRHVTGNLFYIIQYFTILPIIYFYFWNLIS